MGFSFSLFFIQEELRQMSKYLDIVDSALETNLEDIVSTHEKELDQWVSLEELPSNFYEGYTQAEIEEEQDDAAEWIISKHQDEFLEAGRDFPQLLRISFVILWYSFVEQKLLDFCKELKTSTSHKDKKRNHDTGIVSARKFFISTRGYEIDKQHWDKLVYIGKVRNLLVHKGRRIELSLIKLDSDFIVYKNESGLDLYVPIKKDLFDYMHKNNLFEITGIFFEIVPSIDYCKDLVSFANEIFSKLHKDLNP